MESSPLPSALKMQLYPEGRRISMPPGFQACQDPKIAGKPLFSSLHVAVLLFLKALFFERLGKTGKRLVCRYSLQLPFPIFKKTRPL